MIFRGAKFCAHCGATLQRSALAETQLPCPKCRPAVLASVQLGHTPVHECRKCHGLWVEAATFDRICVERERHSAVLGAASESFQPGRKNYDPAIRYVPCPACAQLMHRLNFAKCSGVIVDVCRGHGTWFDRDELQHIVEFIHGGGLSVAREKEKAELETARRRLATDRSRLAYDDSRVFPTTFAEPDLIEIAGSLISSVLNWTP
jgi:Zn-finger nucleic acid-binding protein